MSRSLFSPLASEALRVIALAGATVYLAVFGISMAFGPFTWTPDFLGTHGEPYLVLLFGVFTGLEAYRIARRLPEKL